MILYWIHQAKRQGLVLRYLLLAFLHQVSCNKNPKQYLEQAAEGGSSGAMVVLGLMSHDGSGMNVDMNDAVAWWKKAAEEYSSKDAMYLLGVMYRDGADKFAQDALESDRWFKEGCNAGSQRCCSEMKVGFTNKVSSKSSRGESAGRTKLRVKKQRTI